MNVTNSQLHCKRHPKEETGLRCGKCEDPICPKCAVYTPVGARCPGCARNRSPLFAPSALQIGLAALASILSGIAAGYILGTFSFGFWAIFLAVPYGSAAAELILRSAGRKRGRMLEIVAGAGFALGAVGGRIVMGLIVAHTNPQVGHDYLRIVMEAFDPFPVGPVAIAVCLSTIVSRIRYL